MQIWTKFLVDQKVYSDKIIVEQNLWPDIIFVTSPKFGLFYSTKFCPIK